MYRYYGAPAMAPGANKIFCKVCKIRCSDIDTLRIHEAGKKHEMNLAQQAEVVQTVTCEVCQIECGTTLDDLRRHETGENHKRILWKLQEENGPMANLVNKTPAQPATCEVCERQFVDLKCLRVHEEGRKHKKIMRKLQAKNRPIVTCEVCKIQLTTLDCLRIHETGKKHKKNLEKLQDSITPKQEKPQNGAVGSSTAPAAAVSDGVMPAVQPKKNKSPAASPEDLEVKNRREAGSAEGEVIIGTMSNAVKKIPKDVQPVTCEVCKMQYNSLHNLRGHETGKKHKKNLEKLQGSITPELAKHANDAVGASTEPAAVAVADGVIPAVQLKKNKRPAASLEDLEVKRRRVLEAGAAQGELKTCTMSNVVKKMPINCEVCKICCGFTLNCLRIHETGKKHKKNLEKLQGSITPEPAKHANDAVGASTEPSAAAIADGVIPAVQPKKKKRPAETPEDLEGKRRRVLEHGVAEGEDCELHIAGNKHKANLQQHQHHQQQVQQLPLVA